MVPETDKPTSPDGASVPDKTAPETQGQTALPGTAPKGKKQAKEIGGPKGPEPTRFGDWERKGRCVDF